MARYPSQRQSHPVNYYCFPSVFNSNIPIRWRLTLLYRAQTERWAAPLWNSLVLVELSLDLILEASLLLFAVRRRRILIERGLGASISGFHDMDSLLLQET